MRRSLLAILAATLTPPSASAAAPPDLQGGGPSVVYGDGRGHYLAIVPSSGRLGGERQETILGYPVVGAPNLQEGRPPFIDGTAHELLYGDGKRWHQVYREEPNLLPGSIFRDPRYTYREPLFAIRVGPRYIESKDHGSREEPTYKGVDLRQFSVVYEVEGGAALRCGERTVKLQSVELQKGREMLKAGKMERSPRRWRPYALTRDDMGNYYYVDRGFWPDTEKQFRLFAGPKGALRQQKMTNVVSDSEGDIFATKTGGLRLVIGKQQATWIDGDKSRALTIVPVEKNQVVIWNELGVYTGEPAGTPCDIF